MKPLLAFLAGVLFAVGLVISGMTQPSKVVGFLDFFGSWDPSLAFVMGGAVLVNALLYRVIISRKSPLLDTKFHLPTRSDFQWRLVTGGALFGIGWGLAGYCPGPAITSAPTGTASALTFVGAMVAGIVLHEVFDRAVLGSEEPAEASTTPVPQTIEPVSGE